MPKVIVTGPDMNPREFEISSEMTLGRNAGNDINLQEEKASRRHCRFRPDGEHIYVEDLQSSNGTKLNGRKITSCVLKHGDTITIGQHTIVFHDENARFDRTMVLPDEDGKMAIGMKAVDAPMPQPKSVPAVLERAGEDEIVARRKKEREQKSDKDHLNDAAEHLKKPQVAKIATLAALVVVFILTVNYIVKTHGGDSNAVVEAPPQPPVQPQSVETETPKPNPPNEKQPDAVAPPPPVVPSPPPPVIPKPAPIAKPIDPAIQADLTKALAERDKAIGTGNFPGARAALNTFLTAHPKGDPAERAQQELKDTEKLIETALDTVMKQATAALGAKKYRLMTQYCTKLISADPSGKFGKAAREMLTKTDESTEARYNEIQLKAVDQIKLGQLDRASDTLEKALDELGGTKWAELVSSEQLQVLMGRSFMRQLENARLKKSAGGKSVPINLSTKKITGTLTKVNALALEVKSGPITLAVPIKDLPPTDFTTLLQTLGISTDSSLELAYLWVLLEKPNNAQAELERVLKNPQQATAAMRLVSLLPNQQNLRIYDFSKWQHQTDWDALSGSWSTQNDRYVLDSADGGDTALKQSVLGGPFPAKNARVSFDFEVSQPGSGYFFAFELGDDQHALSLIFSAKGVNVHANLTGSLDEIETWAAGPTHVDIAITGNALSLGVNGNPTKTFTVDGLQDLKGTLTFRVREASCAIDNIIIRNVE